MPRKNQLSLELSEQLELKFVKLSNLNLYAQNSKLHDIGAISQSIVRYGFLDPPRWDKNLNGGKGGIVEGNGRLETLQWMFKQGQSAPRGIAVDADGEWCVPVLFGLDAESEAQAAAYSIDHNNLTLAGGDGFTAVDVSRLYEKEAYTQLLQELADVEMMPVSVDIDDLNLLLGLSDEPPDFQPVGEDEQGRLDQKQMKEIECECPSCGHEFIQQV